MCQYAERKVWANQCAVKRGVSSIRGHPAWEYGRYSGPAGAAIYPLLFSLSSGEEKNIRTEVLNTHYKPFRPVPSPLYIAAFFLFPLLLLLLQKKYPPSEVRKEKRLVIL